MRSGDVEGEAGRSGSLGAWVLLGAWIGACALASLYAAGWRSDNRLENWVGQIAADPGYADPVFNLAQLQFEAGAYAAASDLWQRYLALDPDSDWSRKARQGVAICRQQGGPG